MSQVCRYADRWLLEKEGLQKSDLSSNRLFKLAQGADALGWPVYSLQKVLQNEAFRSKLSDRNYQIETLDSLKTRPLANLGTAFERFADVPEGNGLSSD